MYVYVCDHVTVCPCSFVCLCVWKHVYALRWCCHLLLDESGGKAPWLKVPQHRARVNCTLIGGAGLGKCRLYWVWWAFASIKDLNPLPEYSTCVMWTLPISPCLLHPSPEKSLSQPGCHYVFQGAGPHMPGERERDWCWSPCSSCKVGHNTAWQTQRVFSL